MAVLPVMAGYGAGGKLESGVGREISLVKDRQIYLHIMSFIKGRSPCVIYYFISVPPFCDGNCIPAAGSRGYMVMCFFNIDIQGQFAYPSFIKKQIPVK